MVALSERLTLAESVDEALAAKQADPGARYLAGGTELFARIGPAGDERVGLISLRRIGALAGISGDETIRVGANVTVAELAGDAAIAAAAPMLSRAARSLGSRQIRARATVGGNTCVRRGDLTLAPCLLALDAHVQLSSDAGEGSATIAQHLANPADRAIVTAITFQPVAGFQKFTRVGPRSGFAYAIASAALVVDNAGTSIRFAAGGCAPRAFRATAAEEFAASSIDWSAQRAEPPVFERFGQLVAEAAQPEAANAVSSPQYRLHAIEVMARRLLEDAFGAERQ